MMNYLRIIIRNLTTPIFLVIVGLGLALLALGEKQDALFVVGVVSINITFGIVQEIRARHKLRQLELLAAPRAKLLVDGQIEEVDYQTLKTGDQIKVELGDELPADGEIIESYSLECDESMLTGESVAVKKQVGDFLYASSAIVAGSATLIVTAVGDDTRVGKMSAKLKQYDPQITPLQQSISRAIQYFTALALILAVLFFLIYSYREFPLVQIVKTITTAAVTVVPEGLLLASTVFLAYGSLRLTQARVLPQKLSAIESMALLDVLCVDKTGTLTSPDISFNRLVPLNRQLSIRRLKRLLGILARETGSTNATSKALAAAFAAPLNYTVVDHLAFSSERKLSAVRTRILSGDYSIVLGAPEYVAKIAPLSKRQRDKVDALSNQGLRVLLIAELPVGADFKELDKLQGRALALVCFDNQLRTGVRETIDFMQDNQISIRVISGDNPQTVAHIAAQAGIKAPDRVITGAELARLKVGGKTWDERVLSSTIFARVLPEQKEKIIDTFQRHGLYTGMVGDGVNDALALKSADLGVAMRAGAAASRRVSDLILLDNAFTALPVGMKLGSQIMLSIEMVACLAFHKIFFGIGLSFLTLLFRLPYPFLPRHMTFMNIFLLTLPTILITLFTPTTKLRVNPKYFWRDTLWRILPLAMLSALGIFLAFGVMVLSSQRGVHLHGQSTIAVLVATFFGMYMVYLTNLMFKTQQTTNTTIATITYVAASSLIALLSFGWRFARNFFVFRAPNTLGAAVTVVVVVIIALIQYRIVVNRLVR